MDATNNPGTDAVNSALNYGSPLPPETYPRCARSRPSLTTQCTTMSRYRCPKQVTLADIENTGRKRGSQEFMRIPARETVPRPE